MKQYQILINEEQRKILLDLIAEKVTDDLDPDSEIRTLLELFDDLPAQEVETPGVLHGFCL